MNVGLIPTSLVATTKPLPQFEETLELAPDFGLAHVMMGRVYVAKGMPDRAVEELERAQASPGCSP